ncbi:uncharacterized protein JCM10292_005651 [Rhodotorula paludigena]|uniref:uncharacterized protein n=1 Tax=Rhodotorula paludigena TaxID=86838 RepID=UPI00317EB06B
MSYDQPRPYRPQQLSSPSSYDSLQAPPSVTTWSQTASYSGQSSPAASSERVDGVAARFGGPGARGPHAAAGRPVDGRGQYVHAQQGPAVLQKREQPGRGPKHEVVDIGGTGVMAMKEDPRLTRKRVFLMCLCGAIVAVIVVLVVLGCKDML